MRRLIFIKALFILLLSAAAPQGYAQTVGERIALPVARISGDVALERAIYERTSIRSFKDRSLRLDQLSQLLWAGAGKNIDGLTGASRTAPSAGGLYPLEFIVVVGKVQGMVPGIYRYTWKDHALRLEKAGDMRESLATAALNQRYIQDAPLTIIITAVFERTTRKYGRRGANRYVYIDAGHAAQNIFLQTVALDLGTVVVGAFTDQAVQKLLDVKDEAPLLIMPIGWPAR